ncbi:hypothetical protein ACHAW6_003466 [Cyclotella cf. meneghiniana]
MGSQMKSFAYTKAAFLCHYITPSIITKTLCDAVTFIGMHLGMLLCNVSTWSLCATGTMDLLVSSIDTDIIKMLSCW